VYVETALFRPKSWWRRPQLLSRMVYLRMMLPPWRRL
jgi:hypothetical protein